MIPIGIDPDAVQPIERRAGTCRVIFIDGLHWPSSAQGALWFARQVFPVVRARFPGVVWTVIGRSPRDTLERSHSRSPADLRSGGNQGP